MESRIRQTLADFFDPAVAETATLDNLGGHASLRIYWRIHLPQALSPPRVYPRGETTLMAMVLPEGIDPLKSAEGTSSADSVPTELPFVNVQRYLAAIGMPVGAIDRVDMERGVLLIEDLGDRLFEHAVLEARTRSSDAVLTIYRAAIDLLVSLQKATESHPESKNTTVAFERRFDEELLRWELDHYREWGLEEQIGKEKVAPFNEKLDRIFDNIATELAQAPQTLALRDFQSRNIMFKGGRWVLIDFQDALIAPVVYDLVALLRDSYIELHPEEVSALVDYYISQGQQAGLTWCDDAPMIHRLFQLQTVQRKLKDAGRFIFIDRVRKNSDFLGYYTPSIQLVRAALDDLEDLTELAEILAQIEPEF